MFCVILSNPFKKAKAKTKQSQVQEFSRTLREGYILHGIEDVNNFLDMLLATSSIIEG